MSKKTRRQILRTVLCRPKTDKLREINKLINDNNKGLKTIKFLYATRDDIFAHKNRAKFFDFIIPIIPIINNTNSLEKMRTRLKGEDFENKINEQFLRDISYHIDDMRLHCCLNVGI